MRVIFRADASVLIGTGHIMRCLTLAEALRKEGAYCKFVTRDHPGHLLDQIMARGFDAVLLKSPIGQTNTAPPVHAAWSGVPWQQDAEETRKAMGSNSDWLVVDHYAFDSRWQHAITKPGTQIMVIDDLADRTHKADLLLDQNLGRKANDYDGLVPEHCKRLIGLRYALLRPEFMAGRAVSLSGRLDRPLRHILISMDVFNFTVDVASFAMEKMASLWSVKYDPIDKFDNYLIHQANNMVTSKFREKMNIDAGKMPSNLELFGNTSGSTIPLLICSEHALGSFVANKRVLLLGFGVGLAWSAIAFDIPEDLKTAIVEI
mgnify:CR=1 FL=1|tara:strand:- start:46911 stop:47864 length:954 start_codon:yes stop_codon:yes gene_type:complete